MADEDTPETPGTDSNGHAVPSEQAAEIAGSTEDAALEAAQEAKESGATTPEPPVSHGGGEGHAVPSDEATEIAGSTEDAALEAAQEAAEQEPAQAAVPSEAPEAAEEPDEEPAPRVKPSVPNSLRAMPRAR